MKPAFTMKELKEKMSDLGPDALSRIALLRGEADVGMTHAIKAFLEEESYEDALEYLKEKEEE